MGYKVTHRVTAATREILNSYPELAKLAPDLPGDRSALAIVERLHSRTDFLSFLADWLPKTGDLGRKLLRQVDEALFRGLLAEVYMFAALAEKFGEQAVKVASTPPNESGPDLWLTARNGHECAIEIYSPIELSGYDLFCQLVPKMIKGSEPARGHAFDVKIEQESILTHPASAYWAYGIPADEVVLAWAERFEIALDESLRSGHHPPVWFYPGPRREDPDPNIGQVRVRVAVKPRSETLDRNCDPVVTFCWGTSTDTHLFFQMPAADLAKSEWGRKLGHKLRKSQAGGPDAGHCRTLAINFSYANTPYPNVTETGRIWPKLGPLCRELLGADVPYDLVLPCVLKERSIFGAPIRLAEFRDVESSLSTLRHLCAQDPSVKLKD